MGYTLVMCYICRHLRRGTEQPTCDAFPRRIPQPILELKFDHRQPYKGDRGIQFEPYDGVTEEEMCTFLGAFDGRRPSYVDEELRDGEPS